MGRSAVRIPIVLFGGGGLTNCVVVLYEPRQLTNRRHSCSIEESVGKWNCCPLSADLLVCPRAAEVLEPLQPPLAFVPGAEITDNLTGKLPLPLRRYHVKRFW